ncbi:Holliday junction branch migration protein RuvA [Marinimicrobium sp. ABcell2]|uniref:Holliday junction branch migration protein RuvA n=1 Tax=Marinimicrobium sp. ABcell2 TaxID=3069751 RepID=UPI0027B053C9|nr:Holliday junction branch migration protein RuvA [Marinimicrobium sp. ABcell2]MDQ2077904.1 Holliday junction branch migration protein RuvA [Marinimicrobium sp. ABcell2]
MIGRLRGVLVEKQPPHLLIDVQGVGYEVQAPMTTFYRLPELGAEVLLYTHLSVSETAQQLFGFADQRDRTLFRTLIKVSGVGPKMAVAILSGMEADDIARCVREDKVSALVKVPGVGKKTAERLVIELRDRLKAWELPRQDLGPEETPASPIPAVTGGAQEEAESALIALGYKPTEAARMVSSAARQGPGASSQELIRLALRSISQV